MPPWGGISVFDGKLQSARRRQTTGTGFASCVTCVSLCLRSRFQTNLCGQSFFFFNSRKARRFSGFFFGLDAGSLSLSGQPCALFRFAGKPFLLLLRLLGFAYGARLEDSLTLGPAGDHFRIVVSRLRLEFVEERFFCSICRVAPLSKTLIPVYRQCSVL